jgi:hypothetical protein
MTASFLARHSSEPQYTFRRLLGFLIQFLQNTVSYMCLQPLNMKKGGYAVV